MGTAEHDSGFAGLTVAGLVVAAHLLTNAAHGVVHGYVPVALTSFQQAFVVIVVGVAPLAAVGLVSRGRERAGLVLLAASLAGSLCFGVAFHFLLSTPDHVHAVADHWRVPFGVTASLAAVADAVGLAISVSLILGTRRKVAPAGV